MPRPSRRRKKDKDIARRSQWVRSVRAISEPTNGNGAYHYKKRTVFLYYPVEGTPVLFLA